MSEPMSLPTIKNHKILLIEDNLLTVKLVRLTLESEGYTVLSSVDGKNAIAMLKNETPKLILLDMRLPDTTGLSLVKELRALPNGKHIPIISFSGFISMVEEAKLADSGFTDILLKPIEPSLLLECVESHLIKEVVNTDNTKVKRIALIVDDDPLQLKFTGLQFNYSGFEVIYGKDGLEGLELALQHRPDVIISDVLMPNMDGFQFCKAIRENPAVSNIPLILVSANYVEDIDQQLAKNIGANAYVYRSLGIQTVVETVLECMGNKEPLPPVNSHENDDEIEKSIYSRVLQQLERQVSINLSSQQRGYEQQNILKQINDLTDSLVKNEKSKFPLDEILSNSLYGAGLSQGLFYHWCDGEPLELRAQFGFDEQLEKVQDCFGFKDIFLDIIKNKNTIAIPSDGMEHNPSYKILSIAKSSSALFLPVRLQHNAAGLLVIFSRQNMLVDEDWIAFGHNVAAQFSQSTELSDTFSNLMESEQRFRQLAENIRDVFFLVVPVTYEILYLSPAYEKFLGRTVESLIQHPEFFINYVVPEDKAQCKTMLKQLSETGSFSHEIRIINVEGKVRWINMRGTPIADESGNLYRVAGIAEDITERKESELQLQYVNRLYELLSGINALTVRAENQGELFDSTCQITVEIGEFDLAWIGLINHEDNTVAPTAKFGKSDYINTLTESIFSTLPNQFNQHTIISKTINSKKVEWMNNSEGELININSQLVFSLKGCQSMICLPLINDNEVVAIAMLLSKRLINFNASKVKLLNMIATDISYAYSFLQAKKHIEFIATHEPITGLGNRTSLKQRIKTAIISANGGNYSFGLILINLNGFRDINDTLGHKMGDILLNSVAKRLVKTVWRSDMVACLGGDEFAILIPHLSNQLDINVVTDKVNEALCERFYIHDVPLNIEARIGIALFPVDADNGMELWQYADVALSTAKKLKQPVCFYDANYDAYDSTNLSLLGDLREAITANQLVLHWQPKIDLTTQTTIGAEALIRWQHPTRGLLFPDEFIPFVESTALIQPLTRWVVENAILQASEWESKGYEINVAINVSVHNLQETDFDKFISTTAEKNNVPIERITIEVTESAVMNNVDKARISLEKMRSTGIKIAMDDFGTGQSSLAYLKDLPITDMKIDQSFIMHLNVSGNHAIVKSAIGLAHNLAVTTTAEGVEDEETLLELKALGCDVAQGYFISKPISGGQFIQWMTASKWPNSKISS
jgi:diguanylate cyclase (GGDEF)-like protein/PAS domain S-box-containing protein